MHGVGQLLAVSLIVMGLSHTIARERIFEPLRARLGGKETWLGYLVSCPYCVSHWIALVLVPITGTSAVDVIPRLGPVAGVLRWLLSSILVTVLAAFFRVIFYFVDETQGLVKRQQKSVEAETENRKVEQETVRPNARDRADRQTEHTSASGVPVNRPAGRESK